MKTKYIYLILSVLFAFSSCHGDLDVKQTSEITANSMWEDENDATSAMYGVYNKFRSTFNQGYMYWGEYRTGLWGEGMTSQPSRDKVYENELNPDHAMASWTDIYTTINDANLVLKYTPNIPFGSEVTKNKVLGNAYFVRAYCYYWIARIWGDAPILLDGFESDKQEGLFPSREPVDKVFQQVESDLAMAASLMPASVTDRNMASPASIQMLTADYFLWMYKVKNAGATALDNADKAVTAVLTNANYGLEDSFASIFENEQGREIIQVWRYIQDEYTNGAPADYLVPLQYVSPQFIEDPVKIGSHQQWCFFTDEYKTLLSEVESDQRTKVSFDTFFDEPKNATFQWVNKYAGSWVNETRIFDADIILYRYADALLFDAEINVAKGDLTAAVASLNQIAKRAYGVDNYYPATLSADQLNDAILKERMKEFAAEGKLWWDYLRMGVAFKMNPFLKGRESELNVLLWPVSAASVNKNPNIKQTPGYDK